MLSKLYTLWLAPTFGNSHRFVSSLSSINRVSLLFRSQDAFKAMVEFNKLVPIPNAEEFAFIIEKCSSRSMNRFVISYYKKANQMGIHLPDQSHEAVIRALSSTAKFHEAKVLLETKIREGLQIDPSTILYYMKCLTNKHPKTAKQLLEVYGTMLSCRMAPSLEIVNLMMEVLNREGQYVETCEFWESALAVINEPTEDTFVHYIEALSQLKDYSKVLKVFRRMCSVGIFPRADTLVSIAEAAKAENCMGSLMQSFDLRETDIMYNFTAAYNMKIFFLVESKLLKNAFLTFDEMTKLGVMPDIYTYEYIISGFAKMRLPYRAESALALYEDMKKARMNISTSIFNDLIFILHDFDRYQELFEFIEQPSNARFRPTIENAEIVLKDMLVQRYPKVMNVVERWRNDHFLLPLEKLRFNEMLLFNALLTNVSVKNMEFSELLDDISKSLCLHFDIPEDEFALLTENDSQLESLERPFYRKVVQLASQTLRHENLRDSFFTYIWAAGSLAASRLGQYDYCFDFLFAARTYPGVHQNGLVVLFLLAVDTVSKTDQFDLLPTLLNHIPLSIQETQVSKIYRDAIIQSLKAEKIELACTLFSVAREQGLRPLSLPLQNEMVVRAYAQQQYDRILGIWTHFELSDELVNILLECSLKCSHSQADFIGNILEKSLQLGKRPSSEILLEIEGRARVDTTWNSDYITNFFKNVRWGS